MRVKEHCESSGSGIASCGRGVLGWFWIICGLARNPLFRFVGENTAIVARRFRAIHCLVRFLDQLLDVRILLCGNHSQTSGDLNTLLADVNLSVFDVGSNPFNNGFHLLPGGCW